MSDNGWRAAITAATRARGYLGGEPRLEITGQMLKLVEELVELAVQLGVTQQWSLLSHVGTTARWMFDQRALWQPAAVGTGAAEAGWQQELADVVVALVNLVAMLEETTGHSVDLQQLAVDKAVADTGRGVGRD